MSDAPKLTRLANAMKAMELIQKAKPKAGDTGNFPCPKCGKTFRWSFHGHRAVRGSCETTGCLMFMS